MVTHARREIIRILEQLGDVSPDVRFGQLIANLSYIARGPTVESIWEMEDEELLAAAKKHLDNLRAQHATLA